mmetsp:Transcript_40064/g.95102  ORF Transcript_40064/g.95102 Transcript_40064/m.95102 type:complete len:268 (-) Transcript_40064:3-806(-)
MLESSVSRRLMSSTYSTPRCAFASNPGSNTVLPSCTDFSTSTDPRRRSSSTFSGTWTKGHSTISLSRSASVWPFASSSARRKSSMSRPSGSVLKGLPLMRSMGGSSLCSALAITDFPVPRPPAMTTPPMSGFTAARSSAVLIGVWPMTRDIGKACWLTRPSLYCGSANASSTAAARASADSLATMESFPSLEAGRKLAERARLCLEFANNLPLPVNALTPANESQTGTTASIATINAHKHRWLGIASLAPRVLKPEAISMGGGRCAY